MIRKLLVLLMLIGGVNFLYSCGTKKPQEKVDYEKVDKAYGDFKNKNN